MATENLAVVIAAIVIAIGPFLAYSIFLMRRDRNRWTSFFFGWGGWFTALLIRSVPLGIAALLLGISEATDPVTALIYLAFASLMAGVFEEGFRYIFLDQRKALRKDNPSLLSFGLGWGVGEAIIIYIPALVLLLVTVTEPVTLFTLLPGAIERNLAILSHIAFTFIVFAAFKNKNKEYKYVLLAMFLHFLLNIIAVYSLTVTQDAWLTEGVVALLTILNLGIAYRITKFRV